MKKGMFFALMTAMVAAALAVSSCGSKQVRVEEVSELVPTGWEVVEDVVPSNFSIADLEFISFVEKGEHTVSGEVMRVRAVQLKANLGLADCEYILAHQDKVPLTFDRIIFPGTLMRDSSGGLHIASIVWFDSWYLSYEWLECGWDSGNVLARSK